MVNCHENTLFYDTSEAIKFISAETGLSEDIIDKVLEADVHYMQSVGIIEEDTWMKIINTENLVTILPLFNYKTWSIDDIKRLFDKYWDDWELCTENESLKALKELADKKKGEQLMLKTYRITPAYLGNYTIEAFESGKKVLEIIVDYYNVEGACRVLDAFGYRCTKREY